MDEPEIQFLNSITRHTLKECISFKWNNDNSYLFVNGKQIIKVQGKTFLKTFQFLTVQVLTLMKKKQKNVCVVSDVYEITIANKKFS